MKLSKLARVLYSFIYGPVTWLLMVWLPGYFYCPVSTYVCMYLHLCSTHTHIHYIYVMLRLYFILTFKMESFAFQETLSPEKTGALDHPVLQTFSNGKY